MPTVLPTNSPAMMPRVIGLGQRAGEPVPPADRDAGGEEREDRHRDGGRERAEAVLEVLGEPGAVAAVAPQHGHGEAEQDTGDRRVDARGVHAGPRPGPRAGAAATTSEPAAAPGP